MASPAVAYYSATVQEIQEGGATICITFTILPYIGPHEALGEDAVAFCVNLSGGIMDMAFKHLKAFMRMYKALAISENNAATERTQTFCSSQMPFR